MSQATERTGDLAAVSWGTGRIDLFWRAADGELHTRHWDLAGWSETMSRAARSPRHPRSWRGR